VYVIFCITIIFVPQVLWDHISCKKIVYLFLFDEFCGISNRNGDYLFSFMRDIKVYTPITVPPNKSKDNEYCVLLWFFL